MPPALLAATLVALVAAPAAATSYTIGTFADDAVVNGNCTLREALRAANRNVAVDACAAGSRDDSIVLPTGTYHFWGQEVLDLTGSLSITSADLNPFHVIVDLHGAGRFLTMSGRFSNGSFVIGGIGISNGVASDDGAGVVVGGAIRAENVRLSVFNFRFVSNVARAGGALHYSDISGNYGLTMANGTFLNNRVSDTRPSPPAFAAGGAAFINVERGSHADLRDVHFIGNSSSALDPTGGALGLIARGDGSVASCVGCSFLNNSGVSTASYSNSFGGAVLLGTEGNATINLLDCRFTGNSAGDGTAALAVQAGSGSHIELDRLFIDANGGSNGAFTQDVYLLAEPGSSISLVDSQLTFGATSGLRASVNNATLRLGHLTIADYPSVGAYIRVVGASQAVLQNSIVVFNAPGNDLAVEGLLSRTTNFIGGDPHFLDEFSGNYRLAPYSPAIDAGTASVVTFRKIDLDRHPRWAGAATDIGSFEYSPF